MLSYIDSFGEEYFPIWNNNIFLNFYVTAGYWFTILLFYVTAGLCCISWSDDLKLEGNNFPIHINSEGAKNSQIMEHQVQYQHN